MGDRWRPEGGDDKGRKGGDRDDKGPSRKGAAGDRGDFSDLRRRESGTQDRDFGSLRDRPADNNKGDGPRRGGGFGDRDGGAKGDRKGAKGDNKDGMGKGKPKERDLDNWGRGASLDDAPPRGGGGFNRGASGTGAPPAEESSGAARPIPAWKKYAQEKKAQTDN